MRYPRLKQRPPHFRLNPAWHPLKQGLVFAGLGNHPGSVRYEDSSIWKNTGTLTNMDPATDWVWVPELGRWALDFTGWLTGEDVTLSSETTFAGTDAWTFALWADLDQLVGGFWSSAAGGGTRLSGDAELRWYFDTGSFVIWTIPSIFTGRHHYAMVHSTSSQEAYIDGVLSQTKTSTNAAMSFGFLGRWSPYSLNGRIADIGLWGRACSSSEISALADPSNAMLSGLLLPPGRRLFPVAAVGFGGVSQVLGGGIIAA